MAVAQPAAAIFTENYQYFYPNIYNFTLIEYVIDTWEKRKMRKKKGNKIWGIFFGQNKVVRGGAVPRLSAPSSPIWIWKRATDPPSKKHKSHQKFCQIEKGRLGFCRKLTSQPSIVFHWWSERRGFLIVRLLKRKIGLPIVSTRAPQAIISGFVVQSPHFI